MSSSEAPAPLSSPKIRDALTQALHLDLIGPEPGPDDEHAEERLPGWERPSMWYLTGFLVPTGTPGPVRGDDDAEGHWGAEVPERAGLEEESVEDGKRAKRGFFPSSMGLSFLVYPGTGTIRVTVTWGDYGRGEGEDWSGKPVEAWVRTPRTERVDIALDGSTALERQPVPGSGGLVLCVAERPIRTEGLGGRIQSGTRAVSVFLVNERPPARDHKDADESYAFQVRLAVECEENFHPRHDLSARHSNEWDTRVADLHYADTPAYATGHGVSADWTVVDGLCTRVRTSWIGSAEVEATKPQSVEGVELSMRRLGELPDGPAARAALEPLVAEYQSWIEAHERESAGLEEQHRATAGALLKNAQNAASRMARGVAVLAANPDALDAFRMANRAVQHALTRRIGVEDPKWRPFQLAFLLLNLPGMADPSDNDRETVDLLFFPTGGGKTEAYLGLAAFAMVYRRLRNPALGGRAGAGVSVIMRYTLRLLTLDQLSRAASLVCALELEREAKPDRYGEWPFEIGLWVGKAATPNWMGRKGDRGVTARRKTLQYKANPHSNPAPIPIENCPWCDKRFTAESFTLLPDADRPRDLRVSCTHLGCEFSGERPLPIVAVDEPLYRRLPAFLIATVDKFAALPWEGPSGGLLGGAERFDEHGFYGAADPGRGARLDAPLLPPDLVIQDELHLITGPLGTMMGLYETAIEGLCTVDSAGAVGKPKIVASTATARRARDQVQAVFARADTEVFPPPGPDRRDSFFAGTVSAAKTPARRYLGIAATGRNPKVVMRRVLLALMGAAEKHFVEAGAHRSQSNPADPYMTLLAYFNSLRELGGARRIVEEEIQNTLRGRGQRRRLGEDMGLFRDRTLKSEVVELTSREPTDQVAVAFERLGRSFHQDGRVDCALATNMISVGLDVPRLGLMVVNGQPKTHAEYIQATSRVGRDDERPGLVVTLLNVHKPRDRSHYERFRHYHETFYRSVESASATPFSARALDRGLAGALVGLARHLEPGLTPAQGVEAIRPLRVRLEERLTSIFRQRLGHQPIEDPEERQEVMDSVRSRVTDLLDSWTRVLDDHHKDGVRLQYQRYEKPPSRPLLHHFLDPEPEGEHERKFRVNRSLRDVEPEVHVYVKNLGDTRSAG
ncbi:MAG: DISARM system helicase DrmA [Acidobacteria bacterium]|nr:DISARM system helicase DrmA [Acidobacteriota bacterium]